MRSTGFLRKGLKQMPRINRVRIINFSYNHDSRHILDELFNFYGGENVLLNLANGGGKSVLVQLFLQPVVPGARIQGRSIAGFFRKKKLPAYIMIEWKLDGAGGYLLTGIGMVSAEAPGLEDEKSRVRHFTFTSRYTGANPFDIAHISLVNRNGGLLEVTPFREAREMMAEKERKDPFSFGYFPEDDGERYARRLAEFGISQDEWRNVIAKINDSEGGLEEIFQKYKKSGQLLNDWIIRTVEKTMFRDQSEAHRLEEMLESLVREVVENERFIVEKKLLDSFRVSFRDQVDGLAELLKGLDEQKNLAGKISALYHYLTAEKRSLQEEYEANGQEMEACELEERRVNLEERSSDYWLRKSEYETAKKKLADAEKMFRETEEALKGEKLIGIILQAARLAGEIDRKNSELSGIEEKIFTLKEQCDTDGRVRRLEYSLKKSLEEELGALAADLEGLRVEKSAKEKLIWGIRQDLQAAEKKKSHLDGEKGRLEERKKAFENYEKDVERKIGVALRRNLLGELAAADIKKSAVSLEKARDSLISKGKGLDDEKSTLAGRSQYIDDQVKRLQEAVAEDERELNGLERDIREYEIKDREISGVLNRYGFPTEIRFDSERLASAFGQLVKSLERRVEEAARGRDDAGEALFSLKSGRLHTPEEFASVFAGLDIQYDTGESYLRSLPSGIRHKMLEGNPLLPYAFILSKADMGRVAESLSGITMRRVIPLIAYEDLGATVKSDGKVARTGDGMAFACLYEGRMFDRESLEKLVAELEQKRDQALDQLGHFTEAHRLAVSDWTVSAQFNYAKDYWYGLGKKKDEYKKQHQDKKKQISDFENEKKAIKKREAELEQELGVLREALRKANEAVETFTVFIERDKEYQDCLTGMDAVTSGIEGLTKRKAELAGGLDTLQADVNGLGPKIWKRESDQREVRARYSIYKDAPEAETVKGSSTELEERLKALKNKFSLDINLLESRQKELVSDRDEKKRDLDNLGLEEKEYAGVVYDQIAAGRNREEITRLERQLRERQEEEKEAAKKEGAADNALKTSLIEVRKLGAEEPLPLEEIKGDFMERRNRSGLRIKELSQKNKRISEQMHEYERITGKIGQLVDVAATDPEKGFLPGRDISAQATALDQGFRKTEGKNREDAERLRNKYLGLKTDYKDKNLNIDNMFKGLDPLWEKIRLEFDDFYYLYERMSLHADKLGELIALYEVQLANLQRNKKDMVQQSFLHGLRVYEEIQWISDNSRVRLQGRARPVQMLKIDLPFDSKEAALQRMEEYIEGCISRVREETRQEKTGDEVRKTVNKQMSSRELLNVFLGNPHISINVFKIDLNMQNSRLKPWEDAVRENSGGEKFVVFFSVLSALMAYTRSRTIEAMGADSGADTRVLVMDNPFGPISSEHLLNPLFEIAKRHRTQLICLSDLKQNSIMNCFNLIYMLKVRTSAIGNNEYLKFEEFIRDESALQTDEKLEKAVYRVSDIKQLSLFDQIN